MPPPSSQSRSPFPSLLISLISLLALGTAPTPTLAAPEPAALAPRPPRHPHPNPNLLPAHLRQHPDPSPLPSLIRDVRFNSPPARTVPSGETQTPADDEDDGFELSPLVLAVTVDGQVHALKRETGQWVWTLHDDGGVALGGAGRGLPRRRGKAGEAYGGPLVRSVSRRRKTAVGSSGRANETGVIPVESDDDNDETYIIEPVGGGDIYVYTRSTGGLEKLPLSMQELVALSPFRFPGDSTRMFSASKNTRFVGVDLKTGRLVGVFGSNAGWCEWDETDELTGRQIDMDCEEDIEKRPEDLLYMARTEYELSIYDATSALPLQTLSYTTYSSSTLPTPASTGSGAEYPSQSSWTRTPDSLYLQPMHDGSLVCFRAGQPGVQWSIDFENPVVSIFDVVVPPRAAPGQARQQPIMFEQPHPLLVPDLPLDFSLLQQEPAATFVGLIEASGAEKEPLAGEKRGELFAMSRDRFPLVPFAQMAEAAREVSPGEGDSQADEPAEEEEEKTGSEGTPNHGCRGVTCIVGRHRLRNPPPPSPVHLDSTIDPVPSEPLLIEAPPSSDEPSPSSPRGIAGPHGPPDRRSPHQPGSSTLLAGLYKSTARELKELGTGEAGGGRFTLSVVFLVLAAWVWTKVKAKKAVQGGKVRFAGEEKAIEERRSRRSSAEDTVEDDAFPPTPTDEKEISFDVAGETPKQRGAAKVKTSDTENGLTNAVRRRSPSSPPTPTSLGFNLTQPPLLGASTSSSSSRARSSSLSLAPALPIVSPLKALPPLPPTDGDDSPAPSSPISTDPSAAGTGFDDPGADSDSSPVLGGDDIATPPRKRNRRRRGAKKKKGAAGKEASATSLDEELGAAIGGGEGEKDAALEGITLSERETRDEDDPSPASSSSMAVPTTSATESAQTDWAGKGVDGEVVAASAPASTVVAAGGEQPTAALDKQLVGGLDISETIIGYGSHGTVVLRGEFQGRAVAVKRLLKDFVTIAAHEVNLLQESDDHPHVIRYFCKEQRETFLYIALELCPASLFDLIDQPAAFPDLVEQLDPKKALRQITSGLRHLHSLKIVHRDIKPQNILVSTAKRGRGQGGLRMLISDFGLCKKLDVDESSFQQTVNHAAGSFGYRAPEVLRGLVDPNESANGGAGAMTPSASVGSGGGSTNTLAGLSSSGSGTASTDPSLRLTRSIDIFSLGCIFYYVLTRGEHPFGGRYEREMNILNGKVSLERLDGLGEEAVEVQDLITRMVATNPRERPTADAVLLHPFFWNAQKRLLFICDASDRFEIMERDPPTPTLVTLERKSRDIVGDDWQKALDRTLLDNLGKYRKYDGASVRDLLRVLRNKKHHYQDLPENVRKNLGDLPGGFLTYFTARFPHLLLHVYDTVATHLADEAMFSSTFRIPEDEA
ncbi:hypothetical protein JCM8097_006498 [Rhodosporidiobolus ruineniae]